MPSIYTEPGNYLIQVAGDLNAEWSDRLGGLTIINSGKTGKDGALIVELRGWLPDQAALYGVLETLYNNHYGLLHVEYLGPAVEASIQAAPASPSDNEYRSTPDAAAPSRRRLDQEHRPI